MDRLEVVIQIPAAERPDFERLSRELGQELPTIESKPLDGALVAQAIVLIGIPALATLRAWLLARTAARQATMVSWKGVKLRGYTAEEVDQIVSAFNAALTKEPSAARDEPE
ncbi:hypothetical protein AB0J82_15735 [Asanoa sp. NPDC049518]|uniref:hypothetical protein n=1 Tax=unclassified Asanoa TaxID=2685164 RepID=UPI003433CD8A